MSTNHRRQWSGLIASVLAACFMLLANSIYARTPDRTAAHQAGAIVQQEEPVQTRVAPAPADPVPPPPRPIYLRSRTFIPDVPDAAGLQQMARTDTERIHILLQLDFIPRDAAKQAYRQQGIELLAYVPDYAWIASVPAGQPSAVLATPGMVWAGELSLEDKLDPALQAGQWGVFNRAPDGTVALYVALHRDETLATGHQLVQQLGGLVTGEVSGINLLQVEMPEANVRALAAFDEIQWIEPAAPPLVGANDGIRAQIGVDTVQATHPGLDGTGIDVLVYDSGQVGDHNDFGARLIHADTEPVDEHSTHVAGTLGGDGTVNATYRGMAPEVDIISYGTGTYPAGTVLFYDRVPDIEADFAAAQNTYGADIGTASLSSNIYNNYPSQCNLFGNYGASSVLIDQIVRGGNGSVGIGDKYVTTWAVGNERGRSTPCASPTTYASISPPSAAKNPIHVGASNTNNNTMTGFSSWGPTDDGRIKPIVVAGGCQTTGDLGITSTDNFPVNGYTVLCGTSMSTPAVAGGVALMLQRYRDVYNTSGTFWPSTAKAILMHTAADFGNPGPDYAWGYGQVNLPAAVDLIDRKAFRQESINQGEVDLFYFVVGPSADPARVTLAWDDYEATFNANPTLINNLDLELVSPGGVVWRPWVLNPASPAANATRGVDGVNNQEMVEIDSPEVGTWMVRVAGTAIPQGPQDYSLVCENCQVLDIGVCQVDLEGSLAGSAAAAAVDITQDELLPVGPEPLPGSGELWQRSLEIGGIDPAAQADAAVQRESAFAALNAAKESGPAAVVDLLYTLDGLARDLLVEEIYEAHQQQSELEPQSFASMPLTEETELAQLEAALARAAEQRAAVFAALDARGRTDPAQPLEERAAATEEGGRQPLAPPSHTVGSGCTFATIAAATVAANPGDILLLEGGVTFNENVVINKDLTLDGGYSGCASGSSARTTIQGTGSAVVVNVSGTTTDLTLVDLNITGGSGTNGGGVKFLSNSTLNLSKVAIYGNNATWGGGIWAGNSGTTLVGSGVAIYNNSASDRGGGLFLVAVSTSFSGVDVYDNTAAAGGGGVYTYEYNGVSSSYIAANDSDIYSNEAVDGAGIFVISSTVTFDGSASWIYANLATGDGGGIYAQGSTINLDDSAHIYNNEAGYGGGDGSGGGAYLDNSDLWGDKARITFNVADDYGGGVYALNGSLLDMDLGSYECYTTRCSLLDDNDATNMYGGSVYAVNSTVDLRQTYIEDSSAVLGGGVYGSGSTVYLYSSVVAENNATSTTGDGVRLISSSNLTGGSNTFTQNFGDAVGMSNSTMILHCSIIWGHTESVDGTGAAITYSDIEGGYAGDGNLSIDPLFVSIAGDDYHLQTGSPVIDRCTAGTSPDFENDIRPALRLTDATPYDMGADEVYGSAVAGLNGAGCGYSSIQQAVNAAVDGDTIQIAGGTYFESVDINGKDLVVEGGYDAGCTTGGSGLTRVDAGATGGSVFDISAGIVTLRSLEIAWGTGIGGGVDLVSAAEVTLDGVQIYDNHGSSGGGVYVRSSSAMTLTNSSGIHDNTASSIGGGGVIYGSFFSNDTYSDINYNCAPNGGGFYLTGGSAVIDDSDLLGNEAADPAGRGGGLYITAGGVVTLTGNAFLGSSGSLANTAYDGAGIFVDGGTVSLLDPQTTIYQNHAANNGGGIYAAGGSTVTVSGAMVGGNATYRNQAINGGGIYATGSGTTINVTNGGRVQYGLASTYGGGIALFDGAVAHIDGGLITFNLSNIYGGGLFFQGSATPPSAVITNTSAIDENEAGSIGGGIYILDDGVDLTIDASTVDQNISQGTTAGLRLNGSSTVRVQNGSTINGNQANGGVAGGLAISAGTVYLDHATVATNTATIHAGGVWLNSGQLDLDDSAIIFNTAAGDGGGVYNVGGLLNLNATTVTTTISSNNAGDNGGGIYDTSGNVLHIWANDGYPFAIDGNSAGGSGGGLFTDNDVYHDLYGDIQITNNTASLNGGGVFKQGGDGWYDDLGTTGVPIIFGNEATTGHGGGVYLVDVVDAGQSLFDGARILGNQAPAGHGGGIYADASTFNLNTVLVVGNSAFDDGGALFATNGSVVNVSATNPEAASGEGIRVPLAPLATSCDPSLLPADTYCSEFRGNAVTGGHYGGGIYLNGASSVTVADTAFIDNTAGLGGAIYAGSDGDVVNVTNGRFTGNSGYTVRMVANGALTLQNNTFASNTGYAVAVAGSSAAVTLNSNVIWGNGNGVVSDAPIGGNSCNISQNGVGGLALDPDFRATGRGDYHLGYLSQAVDACNAGVPKDLDNVARPKDGDGAPSAAEYDMGAFERTCPYAAAAVVDVSLAVSGSDVYLTWPSQPANQSYQVHVTITPFVIPHAGTLVATLPGGATAWTHSGGAGDPLANYYYHIVASNCEAETEALSNQTAEFDFPIEPGTP